MRLSAPFVRRSLVTLALALVAAVPATADPLETTGGQSVLPITGLVVSLPALTDSLVYHLSGSWAIDEDGSYNGRDVLDELSGSTLTAGTWVSLGYFDAGEGTALVNSVTMTDDWSTEADLWGGHWSIHGGTYDLGSLGPTPAVVMATTLGRGMSILMHHYFVGTPAPQAQADLLARLADRAVPAAVWSAASQRLWQPVLPTHRDDVTNRGDIEAARSVTLTRTGITVEIPDDGAVWIVRNAPEAEADFLDRMAPSLPDVSLEIAYLTDMDAEAVFAALTMEKRDVPPRNLPDDWTAGPQLVLDDGLLELTAAYETLGGVVIVGIFQAEGDTDAAYLWPMLESIAAGALGVEIDTMLDTEDE